MPEDFTTGLSDVEKNCFDAIVFTALNNGLIVDKNIREVSALRASLDGQDVMLFCAVERPIIGDEINVIPVAIVTPLSPEIAQRLLDADGVPFTPVI